MRLALDVAKGVREGRRYKDFEVYVSDLDAYGQEIKSTFARYEIPYFIDKKSCFPSKRKRDSYCKQSLVIAPISDSAKCATS